MNLSLEEHAIFTESIMGEVDSQQATTRLAAGRVQFSMLTLILLTTIACLALAVAFLFGRLKQMESRFAQNSVALQAMQPLAPQEVARQLEEVLQKQTTRVKVDDVRYSPSEDAYKVAFSWSNPSKPNDGRWMSEAKLKADGYGHYFGLIHSGEFLKAFGVQGDSYYVSVQSPSPLKSAP